MLSNIISQNQSILLSSKNNTFQKSCNRKNIHSTIANPAQQTLNEEENIKLPRPISIDRDVHLLHEIPLEDVRNFCLVAHVDHGKSSLASRILELTGNLGIEQQWTGIEHANLSSIYETTNQDDNIDKSSSASVSIQGRNDVKIKDLGGKEQIELLDTLEVEKERGITVKASAASMIYPHPTAKGPHGVLLLNMVDSPGHVDFASEVVRTLCFVQGAVLLFDAAQGVQAQSLSVHEKAKNMSNVGAIIPALTKVDLPSARTLDVTLSVSDLFGFDPDGVIHTSARSRKGIGDLLEIVCHDVPSPLQLPDDDGKILRAHVVDSWFEPLRGVVCLVQILSGELSESVRVSIVEPHINKDQSGVKINSGSPHSFNAKDHYSVQDVGLVLPHKKRTGKLSRGQMGYVIIGLRDPRQARPGSVMVLHKELSTVIDMDIPVLGVATNTQSVLYASVHPMEGEGFEELLNAVDRLALNDTGLEIHRTAGNANSEGGGPFLGPGLRVGFQGLLHVEVFQQRLLDEFDIEAIVTQPKVPYKITYFASKSNHNQRSADAPSTETIEDLSKWPDQGVRYKVQEPIVDVRIISPMEFAGNIMDLIKKKRGTRMDTKPIDEATWLFKASLPWAEVVTDFHDELKTSTAGYASFDTFESDPPFVESNLVKVEIMLNGDVVEPLSFISHKDNAQAQGRIVCKKLQDVLPRQQFVTVIQAKADSRFIASERIRAYRKDVLTTGGSKAVGGGDITRKKKLLEKQKKGKKRQQVSGKVTLTQAAFNSVISRSS